MRIHFISTLWSELKSSATLRKNLIVMLGFVKCSLSFGEFKSEISLKKNYKYLLESIDPSVKFEGLIWKSLYNGTSNFISILKLEESGYEYMKPLLIEVCNLSSLFVLRNYSLFYFYYIVNYLYLTAI